MANYLYVISSGDQFVHQIDRDTGTAVRTVGTYNASFSPYIAGNFDPSTGLPTNAALGSADFQNPCSLAADNNSFYALDTATCRVLRFIPDTASVVAAFGGRRGIGSGRITIDTTKRSVIALANNSVWVTDNAGGFLVKYSRTGTFQTEYSITDYITAAAGFGVAFDQITGFAWDVAREVYWALCQGSAATYLLEINSSGALTGNSIDLTARLTSSLSISVPGHSGSPSGRLDTRGLHYRNGFLILWSGTHVIRVDLAGSTGDRLLYTAPDAVAPGSVTLSGSEIVASVRNLAVGQAPLRSVTFSTHYASESIVSRGYTVASATGTAGQIADAWEAAATPYLEETSSLITRDVWSKARIKVSTPRTVQARASIENVVIRTVGALARILRGVQKTTQAKARIEEPTTVADALVESWTLEDSLGAYCQQLSLTTHDRATFQTGNEVTVYAGYQGDRMRMCQVTVDEIASELTSNSEQFTFICRDTGAHEIDSTYITRNFQWASPHSAVRSHSIISTIATAAGVTIGSLEFPNYLVIGAYQVEMRTVIDVVQDFLEPWNQFEHIQYYLRVREGELSVVAIPFTNVPTTGKTVSRRYLNQLSRTHQKYLASPRLTAMDELIVNGATFTLTARSLDFPLGPQTKIEYFHNTVESGLQAGTHDAEYITTDTTVEETTCGDKILERVETVYKTDSTGTELIARSTDTYTYFMPANVIGELDDEDRRCPNEKALLLTTQSVREALDDDGENFGQRFRSETDYHYDTQNQVAVETTISREYDDDEGRWKLTEMSQRSHSQTTGGSVRTQRLNFTIDNGNVTLDSADGQQVSGTRPSLENANSRAAARTSQYRSPSITYATVNGLQVPSLPSANRNIWNYENPHLNQETCEDIRALALEEKAIQEDGYRWDIVSFEAQLTPDLKTGQPIHLEVSEGQFIDYWLTAVTHTFTASRSTTRGEARRLTQDEL